MPQLTPMMQQYQAIKAEHPGAILFFRLGDFYEMFGKDAIEAAKILDITLTARNKKADPIPMCGVPHHAAETYIARLTKAGKKVALCEQVSDPSLPGIVKRKVVRIITPGTTFSEQILNQKQSRYLMALYAKKDYFGLAFADLTTGQFQATEFQGKEALKTELLRLAPAEIILDRSQYDDPEFRPFLSQQTEAILSPIDLYEEASEVLKSHFKVGGLEGFGIANAPFAIQASALLLRYLMHTQKEDLAHLDRITAYHRHQWMALDEATLRNLELFATLRDREQEGTLLSILDETQTSMGGRLLRHWVMQPLLREDSIRARHKAVANLVEEDDLRNNLIIQLKQLSDLERLLGRISSNRSTPRDLLALADSLNLVPTIKTQLEAASASLIGHLRHKLKPLNHLVHRLQTSILPEPPLKITEGNFISDGYNKELDELRSLSRDAKTALKNIESQEIESTGISSLKVKFNKVFGYYIEISKANLDKVPEHYTRKQTLVNAERFVTPALKEYEDKILTAQERIKELEYEIFLDLRWQVLQHIKEIKENAAMLAELDVLLSFAQVAIKRGYCEPVLISERECRIEEGRHPVVESITFEQSFVPNDVHFKEGEVEIKLITGPNMSGKSTYLRQVALIALMNQIGSFVPAKKAHLPVFDRIFTRVGASDNLVRGQSTFMVEMQEAANILNHATEKSLIILDEIGRGTSTYDGLSIAWAIFEHLHEKTRAFSLFATHYHELIQLAEKLSRAENNSIDVQETAKGVLFLHKIKQGGIDRSYGIEVAKLAGMPSALIDRASMLLKELEQGKNLEVKPPSQDQMGLFSKTYESSREPGKLTHPALEKLKDLDINKLTPLEALNTLNELRSQSKND